MGKIVAISKSSVTLEVTHSWDYGSFDGEDSVGKTVTFKPADTGVTINDGEHAVDQDLSAHFKVGEIVTLRWIEEDDQRNHIFFDISKGDDRVLVVDKNLLTPVADENTGIQREQYSKLILGRWEIRTYGHEFNADGTMSMFNPENGEILEKGTWSVQGDKLSMNWESSRPQKVRIKFVSPDLWEWHSTKDRVWTATRIGKAR